MMKKLNKIVLTLVLVLISLMILGCLSQGDLYKPNVDNGSGELFVEIDEMSSISTSEKIKLKINGYLEETNFHCFEDFRCFLFRETSHRNPTQVITHQHSEHQTHGH